MPAVIAPPGQTTDVPRASFTGTTAPTDASLNWQIWDRLNNVQIASSATTNGWNVTDDGSGGVNVTVPGNAPQGGSPDSNGRFDVRIKAGFIISQPPGL